MLHKSGTVTLDGAGYTYDNAGNRTAKTNYLNSITENYTYDPIYELTQVVQGATTTESYSYDAVGNRLSSLGMSSYAYNTSNELTSTPSATFTYDANGNTLAKTNASGTVTYGWDFNNLLTSVIMPGSGGTVAFKYDPFGRRIQKSGPTGTVNYLYDRSNAIEEMDAGANPLAYYAQGGGTDQPLAEVLSGTVGFYAQDGLGSITSVSANAGALLNTYVYDTFGYQTTSTESLPNIFQYTTRDYDPETGLHYYRARYYDAAAGRFLSEDPLQFNAGNNFYEYSYNNPVNFRDPSGLQPAPSYVPPPPPPPTFTVIVGGGGASGGSLGATFGASVETGSAGGPIGVLIALDLGLLTYDGVQGYQLGQAYGWWGVPSARAPQPQPNQPPAAAPAPRTIPEPECPKRGCRCTCRADADDTMPGNIRPGLPLFAFGTATAGNCAEASKEAKRAATRTLGMKPKHIGCKCAGK